jgi:hypothetical protein
MDLQLLTSLMMSHAQPSEDTQCISLWICLCKTENPLSTTPFFLALNEARFGYVSYRFRSKDSEANDQTHESHPTVAKCCTSDG